MKGMCSGQVFLTRFYIQSSTFLPLHLGLNPRYVDVVLLENNNQLYILKYHASLEQKNHNLLMDFLFLNISAVLCGAEGWGQSKTFAMHAATG